MSQAECCICLQSLFNSDSSSQQDDGEVGVLPCGHILHYACGVQSLENKPACPICRAANPARELTHLRTDDFSPVDPVVYLSMIEADYRDVTKKNEVLSGRMKAMATTEQDLFSAHTRLEKELDSLKKTDLALAGLRSHDLSVRAENEQRRALEQCSRSTLESNLESRKKHSQNLRMLSEIERKIAKTRQEIGKEQSEARKRGRDQIRW